MPPGQPTKYRPEYCERLVAHMSNGYSYEAFAGIIGVCDDTLREWEKVWPEFSAAKKRGVALSRVWWEKVFAGHAAGKIKNGAAATIFAMKCKFQWREAEPVLPDINLTLKYNIQDDDDSDDSGV